MAVDRRLVRPCAGAEVARSGGTSGLHLPGSGGALCRDGFGLDHLPLRPVRGPVPMDLCPVPRCWPSARVSSALGCSSAGLTAAGSAPTGRPVAAGIAGLLATSADSALAVRAMPAVRTRLPHGAIRRPTIPPFRPASARQARQRVVGEVLPRIA